MRTICLHDKDVIAARLRRNPALHIYALGDLDDFFWPYTTWYGLEADEAANEICLLYNGVLPPILLALTDEPGGPMRELVSSLLPLLPRHVYAHLSAPLVDLVDDDYAVDSHGVHYKMVLDNVARLDGVDTSQVVALTETDLPAIQRLYDRSYPGNSFDPRMLATGYYRGVQRDADLRSVAGIHVYSRPYGVAALGNITTDPAYRGQGLATAATAALCRDLLQTVDLVGLNVKADNQRAIATYERLGFSCIGEYVECALELKC